MNPTHITKLKAFVRYSDQTLNYFSLKGNSYRSLLYKRDHHDNKILHHQEAGRTETKSHNYVTFFLFGQIQQKAEAKTIVGE